MRATRDFSIFDVGESHPLSFDFANDLVSGETIIGTPTWTCTVVAGTDASAASRLVGSSATAGSIVSHRVSGLVAGVKYRLQCVITTSQGNTLSLWNHVKAQAPK